MTHTPTLLPATNGTAAGASALRRTVRLLVALLIGLPLAATTLFLVTERAEVMAETTARIQDGARLLEEHFRRVFRATDYVLLRTAAQVAGRPVATLRDDPDTKARLEGLATALPEPGHVFLFDGDGAMVASSRSPQPPGITIADRPLYRALRDGKTDFFIGPMVEAAATGKLTFHVGRAIRAPDGSLAGVASVGYEVNALTDFYDALSLGKGATIGVYGLDGRVVVRQPAPERILGKTIAGGPLLAALAQSPNGLVTGPSQLDGTRRLIAYRSLPEFGLVVGVAAETDQVLADWRGDATVIAVLLAIACTGIAALAWFAFRALDREERMVKGLEATVRDRTEEARRQAAEAQRANATKTKFLAAASHDLRQPIQAAGMFVEVLAVRLADTPSAAVVDRLRQSVDATQTLLTTLLDASTLEAGQVEPSFATFPIAPLMATLIDQMEPQAEAAGLTLRVVPSSARVTSDPVLLERMLRNLLVNALRYTPSGGKVLLGCRPQCGSVDICVVDTGPGIPADKLDVIFEDFTRLGDKGSGAQRGLGLGLPVVRRMADLLGHRVTVRSQLGKGSCFTVRVTAD